MGLPLREPVFVSSFGKHLAHDVLHLGDMFSRTLLPLLLVIFMASNSLAASDSAPCRYSRGLLWIDVHVGSSSKSLRFLLDSGAEESVIDTRAAEKLGVKFASRELVQKVGGTAAAYRTQTMSLRFAGATMRKSLLALDLRSSSRACGRRIDGLLGADFFGGRIVQIDYAANKVRLLRSSPRSAGARQIPITMNFDAMCVPLLVDGNRLNKVRIDTGCDQALHWTTSSSESKKGRSKKRSIGLSKGWKRSKKCNVRLGNLSLGSLRTSVRSHPIFPGEEGLLGNPALSRYVVTFDMRKGRLILQPGG